VAELEVREIEGPTPAPGEVLVQVSAASINPIDWKLRRGELRAMVPLTFPAVLGRDVSGVVLAKGPGVTALQTGDRVVGLVEHGYAERVVASADAFTRLPEGFDLCDAAALPLALLTGAQLIEEAVRPVHGQTVLVTGALGSVGRVAVFVARRHGAHVTAGVRASQREQAAGLGCERVVALDDDEDLETLEELDAIADTVGHETIARLLPCLRVGGTLGTVVGEPPGAAGKGFTVRALWAHADAARLAELVFAVARGELVLPIAKRLPLAQGAEGQRLAEQGGLGGKVLLLM
jgi:NADPH:quinone reductase-like Zn-dependent oxidoreductase